MDKIAAVILAGGSGKRMGGDIKKQYILLKGKEILAYTIEVFEKCEVIDEIVVVTSKDEMNKVQSDIINKYNYNKKIKLAIGGEERQDSVYEGLKSLSSDINYVAIHDGARPFVGIQSIVDVIELAKEKKAAVLAVPVKDTIKEVQISKETKKVLNTPDRSKLWAIQTPQVFEKELILKAYEYLKKENIVVTDDSMVVEAYGEAVYIVEGSYNNIKITTKEDLAIGEAIMNIIKSYK